MNKYTRTDLACEATNDLAHIEGTEYTVKDLDICVVERLDILSDSAAEKLGKKRGRYITVTTPRLQLLDNTEIERVSRALENELRTLLYRVCRIEKIDTELSILVIGLGNQKITADAIGPEVIERLNVTGHLKTRAEELFHALGCCSVFAISPGVLGKTGIESADIVRSAAKIISPRAIIVIDALVARSVDRLARTIQISDTGITPGAGIGNIRSELNRDALGVPVIAIGVPTVVDSATMVYDALASAGIDPQSEKIASGLDLIDNFFVTPKDTDAMIESAAMLIARSLNDTFVISG